MSEKRFEKSKSDITDYRIYDYEKEDAYFIDCDDESTVDAIVDLLNEQQTRIELLEDNCLADNWTRSNLEGIIKEQQATINKLQEENASLKQRIRDIKYNNCD